MPDPTPLPRYMTAVLGLVATVEPGTVQHAFVLHEPACPRPDGGACSCTPTTTLGFTLWYRRHRRGAWEPIATVPTERDAYSAVKSSGRRNGDWQVLPAGKQP